MANNPFKMLKESIFGPDEYEAISSDSASEGKTCPSHDAGLPPPVVKQANVHVPAATEVKAKEPVNAAPAPQAEPAPQVTPAPQAEPAQAEAPVQAEKTATAEAPVQEEAPVQAETPVQAEAPVQEEAPVQAETPVQAEAPAQAEETATAEAPVLTETAFSADVWPKSAILAHAKLAEKRVSEWIATYGNKFDQLEFAFNFFTGSNRVHVVYDPVEIPEELWFIGDLHGDILALDAALSYIDTHAIDPTIVFLGDLFDRFDYGLEVVMRVLALIIERPGKILWLSGNHDSTFDFRDGRFVPGYTPAEFNDYLNAHPEYKEFGKWLAEFTKTLPVALFLPDGLFVAHGGCLGFDVETFDGNLIDKVSSLEELEAEKYLEAFVKNRFYDGIQPVDLPEFMTGMSKLLGFPVKRMLRGHDHCKETRYELSTEAPYLTFTTMSAWYLGDLGDPRDDELHISLRHSPITTPAIAKFRYGVFPEIINLNIPQSVVEQFHPVIELPGR